ncbi:MULTISPECIES: helix-turn-helix transcriptional regulator [Xanthomonas]|uniref:helix-turn-helix transcriptional regulator n=1 Tax=Xanthomonas TaxID=338 RepID=UPI00177C073B|nr:MULTISPECIES: hypothetical protein [Xanthomonas]MBD7923087.1 hypothetical protein [Xanthomonas surreyensis]UKE51169.1 hypothetical protein KCU57_01885 [Xanthomonas translucens]
MSIQTKRPPNAADDGNSVANAGHWNVMTAWLPDSPTLSFKGLLKITGVSKSKAYELKKADPTFPKGIPLYDSDRSPRLYWTHEAIAWVEGRASKLRIRQEGN